MQKHQSVSPAGVRGSSVGPGSSTDDSNLLHGPVIILAPPGSGKTHYLEDMRAMGKAQGFHDADDILAEVLDEPPEHCDLCWECFHEVAKTFELQVFSTIEAAVAAT